MLIELHDVHKRYASPDGPEPVSVLRALNLEVAEGEAVAVVGPSGSGKSTLLHLMGGLDRPTAGTVSVGGRDLAALGDAELAAFRNREVGFVFQMHHLLPQCTVLENVLVPTLPNRAAIDAGAVTERARALLAEVSLGHRLNHRPAALSGGEQQRVAVVRALINQPRLVLADEPTGSLDHAAALALWELLVTLNRKHGTTLVAVTHAVELAQRLDRVLHLRDGTVGTV